MKSFTQLAPIMALVVIAPNGASAARSCFEVLKEMQALVNSGMFGVPVPKCEANGDWFPLQCHSSTGMCFCVHPNGDTLADPTRSLRMCKCFQHRHKVLTSGLVGAHVPTCENDSGFYKKLQCEDQYCWCADKKTGVALTAKVPSGVAHDVLRNCIN